MEGINRRFKELRKALEMNQIEFAKRLGFSQSGITNLETGRRAVSDRHVKVACSEFNVSEKWLRTGEGDMFVLDNDALLDQLAAKRKLDDKQKNVIKAFLSLSSEQRDAIVEFASNLVSLNAADQENGTMSDDDVEKEVASYRAELKAQQKGQSHSTIGSDTTNGDEKDA